MCGIVGIIKKNKQVKKEELLKMNSLILHRGPDSEGSYLKENVGLAMRRLKIIDLSGGDQPIYNEKQDILVFLNGEIYNYQEIKDQLVKDNHKFKTKSDTEVLVHGYEQWGIKGLLDRIEGMFLFVLYDLNKERIYIGRDRFGEKPLYYSKNNSSFIFGSELKTLTKSGLIEKLEINPTSLYHYLALHFVPGDQTIIKNIFKLNPGHFMSFNLKKFNLKITRYWKLEEKKELLSVKEATEKTKKLVINAVKSRMIADVPVGAFLSGGIDSSIMVMIMKKINTNLMTFSIAFDNKAFDESKYSRYLAKLLKTNHHSFYFTEKDFNDHFHDYIYYIDDPIGDQACLPAFLLSKKASKYVTVVLSGEGADEIFGGYSYYQQFSKQKLIKTLLKALKKEDQNLINELALATQSGFPLISSKHERFNLIKKTYHKEIKNFLENKNTKLEKDLSLIKNRLKKAQLADIKTWLPDDLLVKLDRMAMWASIEGRAPYLDSGLAKFAFNLPNKMKINSKYSKLILREAFKKEIPSSILKRKKHGFNIPVGEWLRKKGFLYNKLIDLTKTNQNDLIDNEHLKTIIKEHTEKGRDRARLLFSILVYKAWFKTYLKN